MEGLLIGYSSLRKTFIVHLPPSYRLSVGPLISTSKLLTLSYNLTSYYIYNFCISIIFLLVSCWFIIIILCIVGSSPIFLSSPIGQHQDSYPVTLVREGSSSNPRIRFTSYSCLSLSVLTQWSLIEMKFYSPQCISTLIIRSSKET